MKKTKHPSDDYQIPDHFVKKYSRKPDKLAAIRMALWEQDQHSKRVRAMDERNRKQNQDPNKPAPTPVQVETLTYKPVIARFRPGMLGWIFLHDYRIVLVGWLPKGPLADDANVQEYVTTTEERIKDIANRIWKENYKGCHKTIRVFRDASRRPFMVASNFTKMERRSISMQPTTTTTDEGSA